MKRYTGELFYDDWRDPHVNMVPSSNGEWVKYTDALAILEAKVKEFPIDKPFVIIIENEKLDDLCHALALVCKDRKDIKGVLIDRDINICKECPNYEKFIKGETE